MTRKEERDYAFKLLFQADIQKETAENILEVFYSEFEDIKPKSKKYISDILFGVEINKEEIDSTIIKYSKGWGLDRISKVALAALRLAVFEIVYSCDIPNTVAVSEAVGLVKLYDTEESTSFVNGILASVLSGS